MFKMFKHLYLLFNEDNRQFAFSLYNIHWKNEYISKTFLWFYKSLILTERVTDKNSLFHTINGAKSYKNV